MVIAKPPRGEQTRAKNQLLVVDKASACDRCSHVGLMGGLNLAEAWVYL